VQQTDKHPNNNTHVSVQPMRMSFYAPAPLPAPLLPTLNCGQFLAFSVQSLERVDPDIISCCQHAEMWHATWFWPLLHTHDDCPFSFNGFFFGCFRFASRIVVIN
jgi:hypothetical protein